MQNRKRILWAAVFGAVIGALATRHSFQQINVRALNMDHALLVYRPLLLAAAAGWVLLSLYWERAARNSAPAQSSESRASRSFHVFLTNLALLLEIVPIRGLGRFVPVSIWIIAAGLVIEFSGLLLAIWARRHLGRNWSGEITIKVEHELIRSGPYRILRHPIYTGLLMMYAGVLLVTGEWLALIGFVLVGLAYWRKVRLEEANLNTAFGAKYDAYRKQSWALVPGIF